MANTPMQLRSGGTIRVSRFVIFDTGEDYTCVEGTANAKVIGIAQGGSRTAPLSDVVDADPAEAARDLELLQVFGPGEECLLELSGTVVRGNYLKSHSDGTGLAIATTGTTLQRYGAVAQTSGVSGDLIRVSVLIGSERPAHE